MKKNELSNHIQTYFGIPNDQLEIIESLFVETELSNGDYLCKVNEYCNQLSFIKQGYIRIFDYTDNKEVTQWISGPGDFITDLASLMFGQPARKNIQAIENCRLYTIYRENYNKIASLVPNWNHLEKLFIGKCFITLEDRVFSFLSMSAEQRYNHLKNYNHSIFNHVPLQFIASMLGMTPETLSRIRKKSIS